MPDLYMLCVSASLQICGHILTCCLSFCLSVSAPVSEASPYETIRSQELNALLGPKGSPRAVDLLCDLHNTTANMGLCLITYSDRDWICLHICKHLQARTNLRSSLAWLMYFMLKHIYVQLLSVFVCFQREMASTPVRYVHFDIPLNEAYSLDSVGKHGFGETLFIHPPNNANSLVCLASHILTEMSPVALCRFGSFEGKRSSVLTADVI